MGSEDEVGALVQLHERVVGWRRFDADHIKTRASDLAGFQRSADR